MTTRLYAFLFFCVSLAGARASAQTQCQPTARVFLDGSSGRQVQVKWLQDKNRSDGKTLFSDLEAIQKYAETVLNERVVKSRMRTELQCQDKAAVRTAGLTLGGVRAASGSQTCFSSICFMDPADRRWKCILPDNTICTKEEDGGNGGEGTDTGTGSGNGTDTGTGSSTGTGTSTGGSGTGGGIVFNPWGPCTSIPVGDGYVIQCGDGSEGYYSPGQGTGVIKAQTAKVDEEIAKNKAAAQKMLEDSNFSAAASRDYVGQKQHELFMLTEQEFNALIEQMKKAAAENKPTPSIEKLLAQTPKKREPISDAMRKIMEERIKRLNEIADIFNAVGLSPGEVAQFYKSFVQRSSDLQKLLNAGQKQTFMQRMNQTIEEMALLDKNAANYKQKYAGYQAILGQFTQNGFVFQGKQGDDEDLTLFAQGFKTKIDGSNADTQALKAQIRTLGNRNLLVQSQKGGESNALPLLRLADDAIYQYERYKDESYLFRANRILERAGRFQNFMEAGRLDSSLQLSPDAKAFIGALKLNNSTYRGYALSDAANEMGDLNLLKDQTDLGTYARALWRSAYSADTLESFVTLHETLMNTIDFAAFGTLGAVEGFSEAIDGTLNLVSPPYWEKIEGFASALINLPETVEAIAAVVEKEALDFPALSSAEKARVIGKVTGNMIAGYVTAGIASKGAGLLKSAASELATTQTPMVARAMKSLNRLEQLGYYDTLVTDGSTTLNKIKLGYQLADASEEFIGDLAKYGAERKLTTREMAHLAKFKDGMSVILREDLFNDFIANKASPTLQLGRAGSGLWVGPTKLYDRVILEAGQSADTYALRLGFDADQSGWRNQAMVRYRLPFKFEYEPRFPKATDPGANKFYRGGGVTSGLVPELYLPNNPLYPDLIDKVPQRLGVMK